MSKWARHMYPFPVIVLQLGHLSEGLGFCSGNEKKKKKKKKSQSGLKDLIFWWRSKTVNQ